MIVKKCPKCGSTSFALESKVTAYLLYIVEDGVMIPNGIDMDAGGVLSTRCTCYECGHKWVPRKCDFSIDGSGC